MSQDNQLVSKFVNNLEKLQTDRAAMATLRRSLTFDLGTHIASYPFVEPFATNTNTWTRKMCYLVAGLYANHPKHINTEQSFGKAVQQLTIKRESESLERRFIILLDADDEQLANRLRQMMSLLRSEDIAVNYAKLLSDLLYWRSPRRWAQQRWAQDFYHTSPTTSNTHTQPAPISTERN